MEVPNMKKRLVIALLCLSALCGCNAETEKDVGDENTTFITESEIESLIDRYLTYEKYTVYSSSSMEVLNENTVTDDTSDDSVIAEEEEVIVPESTVTDGYLKVINENYDTWEEWTAFGESIFSKELFASLTENNTLFINVDGYTYCLPGDMGWYVSSEYTYDITESTAEKAVVEVRRNELVPGEDDTVHIDTFVLYPTENGWRIGEIR